MTVSLSGLFLLDNFTDYFTTLDDLLSTTSAVVPWFLQVWLDTSNAHEYKLTKAPQKNARRTTGVQWYKFIVSKCFLKYIEQFSSPILVYLVLSLFISVYPGLSWSISVHLSLSKCISVYLGLYWTISDYLELYWVISHYLRLY